MGVSSVIRELFHHAVCSQGEVETTGILLISRAVLKYKCKSAECSEDLVSHNANDKICLNKRGKGRCVLGKDYEKKKE